MQQNCAYSVYIIRANLISPFVTFNSLLSHGHGHLYGYFINFFIAVYKKYTSITTDF